MFESFVAAIIEHYVGFRQERDETVGDAKECRNFARVVATATTPTVQQMTC
ncbi:MAG: hypothetical protein ABI557_07015 [Aureliella sp.]